MTSPDEDERTDPRQNFYNRVTFKDDDQELVNLLPNPNGCNAEAGKTAFVNAFVYLFDFRIPPFNCMQTTKTALTTSACPCILPGRPLASITVRPHFYCI